MVYTVVLLREEVGGYSVIVPALPGCVTQGETVPEALDMVRQAISLYAESLEARGIPVPADDGHVSFEMDEASEALVYRVAVREVAAVA